MLPPKFHSFPFHPFPKENKLGTGGMNEIFISNPPFSLVPGTGGNGWERVNFQGATAMTEKSFSGAVVDLLGDTIKPKRTNDRPEAAALVEVLKALRAQPAVVWCERMNSGATRIGTRWVKFGFVGCPDVLGQLRDGRLLGVEVKGPTGKLRPEQAVFLERIRGAGGVAFIARDCRDVFLKLETTKKVQT